MRICVVALPRECLWVKADMVSFAGNIVCSIPERVRGVRENVLYKLTLPLPLMIHAHENTTLLSHIVDHCFS